MKKIYVYLAIYIDGVRYTKFIDIFVDYETYVAISRTTDNNEVPLDTICHYFPQVAESIHIKLSEFADEVNAPEPFDTMFYVRLDQPWPEYIENKRKTLLEGIANGDTAAMIGYGLYVAFEEQNDEEALSWYLKAMRGGDVNALMEILHYDQQYGINIDIKCEALQFAQGKLSEITNVDARKYLLKWEKSLANGKTPILDRFIEFARNNDINALFALDCFDESVYYSDENIKDTFEHVNIGNKFFFQFLLDEEYECGLVGIRQFFKYGIYVEKDEHMVEIITRAIEKWKCDREKYDKLCADIERKYEESNYKDLGYLCTPQEPAEVHFNTRELLLLSKADSDYFVQWLLDLCKRDNDSKYVAVGIISRYDEFEGENPYADLFHTLVERYAEEGYYYPRRNLGLADDYDEESEQNEMLAETFSFPDSDDPDNDIPF